VQFFSTAVSPDV